MAKLYPYNVETQLLALTAIQRSFEDINEPGREITKIDNTLATEEEKQSFYTACVSLSLALLVETVPTHLLQDMLNRMTRTNITDDSGTRKPDSLDAFSLVMVLAEARLTEQSNNISNNLLVALPDFVIKLLAEQTVEFSNLLLSKFDLVNDELVTQVEEARMHLLSQLNSVA